MKNNIQALSASMIAIALLWIIPITSVQAQLSVQQCIEKNDVIGQRLHFAEKNMAGVQYQTQEVVMPMN